MAHRDSHPSNDLVKRFIDEDLLFYSRISAKQTISVWFIRIQPSLRQVETLMSILANLATIATFLAAVQVQAIGFAIDKNTTRLQIATNTFFFLGLFLDVLGGCVAYTGVTQLQRIHALVQKRTMNASAVTEALEKRSDANPADPNDSLRSIIPTICQHLRFLDVMFLRVLDDIRVWAQVLEYVIRALDALESFIYSLDNEQKGLREEVLYGLSQYRTTVSELAHRKLGANLAYSTSVVAPPTVLAGVLCFLLGMMCFLKESKPATVWAPSFAAVGGVSLLLGTVVTVLLRSV